MKRFVTTLILVLLLAAFVVPSASAAKPADRTTIADVVIASAENGEFTLLLAAIQAANPAVLETLDGNGRFTVFAPTDAAFAALGQETLNAVLGNQALLTDILLYHVARGERGAGDVVSADQIRMLNGDFVAVDGTVLNGSVNIIATDIYTDNGVIHVIDAVLLPPA